MAFTSLVFLASFPPFVLRILLILLLRLLCVLFRCMVCFYYCFCCSRFSCLSVCPSSRLPACSRLSYVGLCYFISFISVATTKLELVSRPVVVSFCGFKFHRPFTSFTMFLIIIIMYNKLPPYRQATSLSPSSSSQYIIISFPSLLFVCRLVSFSASSVSVLSDTVVF